MKHLFLLLLVLSSFSCSRYKQLNLINYSYSEIPAKIIWIQVAGLSEEHLSLLKYKLPDARKRLSFENFYCLGKLWSHNLFKLRPSARDGFLSQLTGSKNISNSCKDFSLRPYWDFFPQNNLKVYALESEVPKAASFENYYSCQEGQKYKSKMALFKMDKAANKESSNLFHYQQNFPLEMNKVSFDKSCNSEQCFANIYNNFSVIWNEVKNSKSERIFMIRDFSFLKAIESKKYHEAGVILEDIEKIINQILIDRTEKMIIMLSTSGVKNLEFPAQGKNWKNFLVGTVDKKSSKSKDSLFVRSSLQSIVMSYGAYSHKICGMYDESEVFSRLLSPYEKKTIIESIFDL